MTQGTYVLPGPPNAAPRSERRASIIFVRRVCVTIIFFFFGLAVLRVEGAVQVPSQSAVLNQQPPDPYKSRFMDLGVTVAVEALLIVLLLRTIIQRKRAERELARLLAVERLESSLAASLIDLPVGLVRTEIDHGFRQFIDFFKIDCISLYEVEERCARFHLLRYQAKPGTPLRLSRLNPAEFKWTTDKLLTGQTVVVRTRADVPEEAAHVIQGLRDSGVHSFAGIPLTVDQRVVGALFFSSAQEQEWDPALLEELRLIAAIVGGGLERSRSHLALVESEQLKRSILASLPASVVVLDSHGIIIALNGSSTNLPFDSGVSHEVLQVGGDYLGLCQKAAEEGSEHANAALEGLQRVLSRKTGRFEMEYPWKGAVPALHERWFRMSIVPLSSEGGGVVATHTDVTEQKLAELERKQLEMARGELSGRLIRAQEEERARVARELHDDINQKLGLLAIEIETLEQNLPGNGNHVQHKLAELFKTTNRISSDVQRLSHQLHSSRLDYLGLPAALRRLCEEFATQHNISTECMVDDSAAKLARETGLSLFRIAQECLNNVARHSSACRVRVRLQCLGDVVRMQIADNGTGFDVERENMRRDPGLGLISMRERLRLVKGELSIDSEKGKGTQITASVPLETEERSRRGANVNGQSLPA